MRALQLLVAVTALSLADLSLVGAGTPAAAAPRPGFGWPLAGTVVVERGFDPPRSAYGPGHRGVDLRASIGQRVLSAGPGRVSYAGLLAGRGVVTVTHAGGLRTTYEPLLATVHVGSVVVRGAVLGGLSSGHASCRAGSCLHWGLLRGQTYLNPLSLVVGGPVRLLPLGQDQTRALTGALALRRMPAPVAPRPAASGPAWVAPSTVLTLTAGGLLGAAAWRRQDARGRQRGGVP